MKHELQSSQSVQNKCNHFKYNKAMLTTTALLVIAAHSGKFVVPEIKRWWKENVK